MLLVSNGRSDEEADFADVYAFTGRASCVLGRARECEIRLAPGQLEVSRRHCLIVVRPPHVVVRDLGSRNGTYVNGKLVDEARGEWKLQHGDEVRVGSTVMHVVVRTDDLPERLPGIWLVRELGRGGQGVVHLAHDTDSGRLVALKELTPHGGIDPAAREAFSRELECTQALRHPNIVRFHGSVTHAGVLGFTCEYCPRGNVADLVLRHGGRLAIDEAVPLALQALKGLAYAHQAEVPVRLANGRTTMGHGLVHRDIKPQNLLLTGSSRQPVLKIADFGLAKAFDQAGLSGQTPSGALGGSVAFMSRRQVINYKYARPDVDLWAVMACLYWMLTGRTPRDFPPDADPVAVVLREPPVPVRERRSSIPGRLADLMDEMLDEANEAMPASASELSRTLEEMW
ncbi:protein kinase [Streptomyces sp. KHY 26]|uniref:protein kinase domain-containing protein n=1 Tax=Streptomyces sp. KHY 26 TaxID=3097359 RepID=UPI00376F350F